MLPLRFSVQSFPELSSTNTLVQKYASEGKPEGMVVVTDYQTAGRGKPGRKWISPRGKNLLFSLLLRPPIPAHEAPILTQIMCRSVARVLKDKYGIDSTFKRPNDIMVKGKKICGILIESSSSKNQLQSAIIGIGLNVNTLAEELLPEAISIKEITGREYSRTALLKAILTQIRKDTKILYARPT